MNNAATVEDILAITISPWVIYNEKNTTQDGGKIKITFSYVMSDTTLIDDMISMYAEDLSSILRAEVNLISVDKDGRLCLFIKL